MRLGEARLKLRIEASLACHEIVDGPSSVPGLLATTGKVNAMRVCGSNWEEPMVNIGIDWPNPFNRRRSVLKMSMMLNLDLLECFPN